MGSLTALLLATPLFGLSLAPPDPSLAPELALTMEYAELGASSLPEPAALGGFAFDLGGDRKPGKAGVAVGAGVKASADADVDATPSADGGEEAAAEEEGDSEAYTEDLRTRAELTRIHRPLGIATYAAMGVTLILGGIQYHNLYGFFADRDSNPCVTGDAVFGQGQCSGTPWLHLAPALLTGGLYAGTFAVAALMPDPDDASEGDSEFASTLRLHKLLRWVHLGGMVAQMGLGMVIANGEALGMDRSNDYGTLQALSTLHLGLGLVTFAAMTWAMLLML
jgi:hypothetical protein